MFSLSQLNDLNFRAWTDQEFLELLRRDTKAGIEEVCGPVPDMKYVLVEDSPDHSALVFPPVQDGQP